MVYTLSVHKDGGYTAKTEVWTTYPYSMMVIPTSVHTIGMNFLVYWVHTKKHDHQPNWCTYHCMNNFLYQVHTHIQYVCCTISFHRISSNGKVQPSLHPPPHPPSSSIHPISLYRCATIYSTMVDARTMETVVYKVMVNDICSEVWHVHIHVHKSILFVLLGTWSKCAIHMTIVIPQWELYFLQNGFSGRIIKHL